MRPIFSLLATGVVLAATTAGCQQSSDSLTLPNAYNETWTSDEAVHNPAPSHMAQSIGSGQNGITDPKTKTIEDAQEGTPDQVARMHATQKIQYAMLGAFLTDLGVNMTAGTSGTTGGTSNQKSGGGTTTPTLQTAGQLYVNGSSALGAPLFDSRTPEMAIPSTSALAKEYDIFMAAAPQIIENIGSSTRCPGVVLITNGELTQDGISCLIGKPATADHVQLAQTIVTGASDPTTGQQIAVATLLAAAHISE